MGKALDIIGAGALFVWVLWVTYWTAAVQRALGPGEHPALDVVGDWWDSWGGSVIAGAIGVCVVLLLRAAWKEATR